MNNEKKCLPREHLITAGKLYPKAWAQSDEMRASRAGQPAWPDWCYLPMAGWYAIVSNASGEQKISMEHIADVARLAAIGSWRATQGIYRFDPALYAALIDTPVDGDIPCEVLYRIPEWCVYIETPGIMWAGLPLHGAWAHLESDVNTGRTELRLLTDSDIGPFAIVLHLGAWSLAESMSRAMSESLRQARRAELHHIAAKLTDVDVAALMRPIIEPIMSLLLYLCSQNAEIGDGTSKPIKPEPTKTKRGPRLFAPDTPTTWDVGIRIGAALRRAYHAADTDNGHGETHSGPRPHIRRAHWHGFRAGPMKKSDGSIIPAMQRKFDLRWLPPIAVNLNDLSELPVTIKPVK